MIVTAGRLHEVRGLPSCCAEVVSPDYDRYDERDYRRRDYDAADRTDPRSRDRFDPRDDRYYDSRARYDSRERYVPRSERSGDPYRERDRDYERYGPPLPPRDPRFDQYYAAPAPSVLKPRAVALNHLSSFLWTSTCCPKT